MARDGRELAHLQGPIGAVMNPALPQTSGMVNANVVVRGGLLDSPLNPYGNDATMSMLAMTGSVGYGR